MKTPSKINYHAYTTKTYHECKPLPIGILFSNEDLLTFNFLTNSKRFGLDHKKSLTGYLTLHMNFFHEMALHYMFIETT